MLWLIFPQDLGVGVQGELLEPALGLHTSCAGISARGRCSSCMSQVWAASPREFSLRGGSPRCFRC